MAIDQSSRLLRKKFRVENLLFTVFYEKPNLVNTQPDGGPVVGRLLHTHSYTEIFFCRQHSLSIMTESGHFLLSAGEMLLIPPGFSHHCAHDTNHNIFRSFGILAQKSPDESEYSLYQQVNALINDGNIRVFPQAAKLDQLIDGIVFSSNEPENVFRIVQFLALLLKTPYQGYPAIQNSCAEKKLQRDYERIIGLETLINSCYDQNMTASEIASRLHFSERQLARIIQLHYHTTLRKLVLQKRMDTAVNLLTSTNDSIEQIGQAIGFQAKSNFYREFRLHFGMTPANYRQIHQGRKTEDS